MSKDIKMNFFKIIFLVILNITIISPALSQKKTNKKLSKFMVQLNDTLYVDNCELSLGNWHEFSSLTGGEFLPDTEIINQKQYSFLFREDKASQVIYYQGIFERVNFDITVDSMLDSKSRFKSRTLLSYPIVGISYEKAKAYCNWRTQKFNLIHFDITESSEYKVIFDLPPVFFYENYILNEDSVIFSKKNTCARFNYNCTDCENPRNDEYHFTKEGEDIIPVFVIWPDKNGIQQLRGNVAEMTNEKGIAKGGSYLNYAHECNPHSIQYYEKSEPWLGFRCIAFIRKNK